MKKFPVKLLYGFAIFFIVTCCIITLIVAITVLNVPGFRIKSHKAYLITAAVCVMAVTIILAMAVVTIRDLIIEMRNRKDRKENEQ